MIEWLSSFISMDEFLFLKHRGRGNRSISQLESPANPTSPIRLGQPPFCVFFPSLSPLSPPSASFLPSPCPLCLCVSKPLFKTQRHKVHRVSYKSLSPNPENPIRLGAPPSISFPPPYPLYLLPLLLSYLSVPSVSLCFKTHSKLQMETLPGYENPKPHVDSKPSPPNPWDSTDPCSD